MGRIFVCLALVLLALVVEARAERQDYTSGTGNSAGGYSGVYTDPETGDTVTTVIAPRKKEEEQPLTPIYIYPQVTPQWPPTPGPMPRPSLRPDTPASPLLPTPRRSLTE